MDAVSLSPSWTEVWIMTSASGGNPHNCSGFLNDWWFFVWCSVFSFRFKHCSQHLEHGKTLLFQCLQAWSTKDVISLKISRQNRHSKLFTFPCHILKRASHGPRLTICNCKHGTHRAFCQLCDCPSCAVREPDLFWRTIHRYYRPWRAPGKRGHFQCDTAAGTGWETGGGSAGR